MRLVALAVFLCGCGSPFVALDRHGDGDSGELRVDGDAGSPKKLKAPRSDAGNVRGTGGSTGDVRGTGDDAGRAQGTGGTMSDDAGGGTTDADSVQEAGGGSATDVGPVCLSDLSGVGTGDFSIRFTLTTIESGLTLALVNQRSGCDQVFPFWDVTFSPTAGIVAATNDSASHYVFIQAGTPLNDGKPHKVNVIRRAGKLWYEHDGVIDSVQTPDPYSFGTLPPLVVGSSACAGTTPAVGHAIISDVCPTRL